jgi:hypothetical protein
MAHDRIVIGLDRSVSGHHTLTWAAREAARRHATLLVVAAWPAVDRISARDNGELVHHRVRLNQMQRDAVAAATAGLACAPQVVRRRSATSDRVRPPGGAMGSRVVAVMLPIIAGSRRASQGRRASARTALAHEGTPGYGCAARTAEVSTTCSAGIRGVCGGPATAGSARPNRSTRYG